LGAHATPYFLFKISELLEDELFDEWCVYIYMVGIGVEESFQGPKIKLSEKFESLHKFRNRTIVRDVLHEFTTRCISLLHQVFIDVVDGSSFENGIADIALRRSFHDLRQQLPERIITAQDIRTFLDLPEIEFFMCEEIELKLEFCTRRKFVRKFLEGVAFLDDDRLVQIKGSTEEAKFDQNDDDDEEYPSSEFPFFAWEIVMRDHRYDV